MSRKHYEMLAELIRSAIEEKQSLPIMARRLASALAYENSNFNRQRFLAASGVEDK